MSIDIMAEVVVGVDQLKVISLEIFVVSLQVSDLVLSITITGKLLWR